MDTNKKRIGASVKNIRGNLLLLLATVIVSCLAGEAFLRSFLKDQIAIFPRYHTDAQYGEYTIRRLRPNTAFWRTSIDGSWKFTTNSQGFRNDHDFTYQKLSGVVRILSLGDSHTEGYEVQQNQTFSAVIERYLQGNGINAEVINAGVSGFSTAEELVFLENEGIKYKPDVVVLGFFENDFSDNIKAGLFALEEKDLVTRKKEHIPGVRILNFINKFSMLRWLSENSYLYSYSFNTIWTYTKGLLLTQSQKQLQTEYAIRAEEIDGYQEKLMERLITRMYNFCRKNNIRLIILDIPPTPKPGETQILSSIPPKLFDTFRSNSDHLVHSKEVLHEYRNVMPIHLPHGTHHITEFTHLIYGIETARTITRFHNPVNRSDRSR